MQHGFSTELLHSDLTSAILKAYYRVYNTLGYGFLEKGYQNAMYLELLEQGFEVQTQHPIKVHYKTRQVGEYYADLLVNRTVILELKAAEALAHEHEAQLINYLRDTEIEVGLLLNFGIKPEYRRKIFTNDRKNFV
jgi:GxxExxY protein